MQANLVATLDFYNVSSVESYSKTISSIPMLTKDKEMELAKDLQDNNNLQAAQELIISHLRFVAYIAKGFSGYGIPEEELIQEGNIGLMKAVKRFDPTMGVRLVYFAVHWIKAEIHEFVIKNWRIVKVATTKAQRKLFFNLRKNKSKLGWLTNDQGDELASSLDVSSKDVLEMESRMSNYDQAFDMGNDNDDSEHYSPSLYLMDNKSNFSDLIEDQDLTEKSNQSLYDSLNKLDQRSQDIIYSRWLGEEKSTLEELAKRYSVSKERIRQIESAALKKMKSFI
jgi:RNA polymerase sigma-32 factor